MGRLCQVLQRQRQDVGGVDDDLPAVIKRATPPIASEVCGEHRVRPLALLIDDFRIQRLK